MGQSIANELNGRGKIGLRGGAGMHLRRKSLKADGADKTQARKLGNLIDIAKTIGTIHQNSMRIGHLAQRHGLIDDA